MSTNEWVNPTPGWMSEELARIRDRTGWTCQQFAHGIGWPLRLVEAVEAGEPTQLLNLGEWLQMLNSLAWAQEVIHCAEGLESGLQLKLDRRLAEAEKILTDLRRQVPRRTK